MILQSPEIARRLAVTEEEGDPLVITPSPDLSKLREAASGSVDLRLGTYFVSPRRRRSEVLDVVSAVEEERPEPRVSKTHYVRFGERYILHPGSFVLGVTLEWIRLPSNLAAYVIGKSSWGRRGLVIATATGVHPRFTGCLTLELANLGEIPIALRPGLPICQLFLHTLDSGPEGEPTLADASRFVGFRRPVLGSIDLDDVTRVLAGSGLS